MGVGVGRANTKAIAGARDQALVVGRLGGKIVGVFAVRAMER